MKLLCSGYTKTKLNQTEKKALRIYIVIYMFSQYPNTISKLVNSFSLAFSQIKNIIANIY